MNHLNIQGTLDHQESKKMGIMRIKIRTSKMIIQNLVRKLINQIGVGVLTEAMQLEGDTFKEVGAEVGGDEVLEERQEMDITIRIAPAGLAANQIIYPTIAHKRDPRLKMFNKGTSKKRRMRSLQ